MPLSTTIAFVLHIQLVIGKVLHILLCLWIVFYCCSDKLVLSQRPPLNWLCFLIAKLTIINCALRWIEIVCYRVQVVPGCQFRSRTVLSFEKLTVWTRLFMLHSQRMLIPNSNGYHFLELSMIRKSVLNLNTKLPEMLLPCQEGLEA